MSGQAGCAKQSMTLRSSIASQLQAGSTMRGQHHVGWRCVRRDVQAPPLADSEQYLAV